MPIYIMGHGDALESSQDPARPLSEAGAARVKRVAQALVQAGVTVGQIIHSDKLRARQSAQWVSAAIGGPAPVESPLLAPEASIDPVILELSRHNGSLLLVGHMPFVQRLAGRLLVDDERHPLVDFPTAAVLCLQRRALEQVPLSFFAGGWQINWMQAPALLS